LKIAIVGSGISGLACGLLLQKNHDVTVFEADNKPGGHVNTVSVKGKTGDFQVDTGFIVFNRENYPNFVRLLDYLGVESQQTRMGFSVKSEIHKLEYSGESLKGLLGNSRNLLDWKHWGMILDILSFHKKANALDNPLETVDEFISRNRLGRRFKELFLLPLGSALWSCSTRQFGQFPMEFVTDFLSNHQMLQANNRPVWRVLKGGSRTYVDKIVEIMGPRLKLNTPIQKITRIQNRVQITLPEGRREEFDEVILACHADQCLKLINRPHREEEDLLKAFPYEDNLVTLHSDDSVLPVRKSARASWNALLSEEKQEQAIVTYDMNILQSLPTEEPFCVSLNQKDTIARGKHLQDFHFSHPTFHPGRKKAQSRHQDFIRREGISLCGAYWGYGFHEDGLKSGLNVCKAFGASLP
jgi:predicted NAD/FAD-binding protein